MRQEDIPEVVSVDRESAALPWPASAYRRELSANDHAHYIVIREIDESQHQSSPPPPAPGGWRQILPWLRSDERSGGPPRGKVVGYGGMWLVGDEAHITILAVRIADRGRGFGELLLASLVEMATHFGSHWVTLEVRASNLTAQQLYRKYGFHDAGLRRRYYSDNNEDALIMTTDDITQAPYLDRFIELKGALAERLLRKDALRAQAPILTLDHTE